MDSVVVDKAEAEINRSKRAAAFLDDGVFRDAWNELEARIMAEWRATAPAETERRENCHRLLAAMTGLENILAGYVDSGAVSLHYLADLERADRLRSVIPG